MLRIRASAFVWDVDASVRSSSGTITREPSRAPSSCTAPDLAAATARLNVILRTNDQRSCACARCSSRRRWSHRRRRRQRTRRRVRAAGGARAWPSPARPLTRGSALHHAADARVTAHFAPAPGRISQSRAHNECERLRAALFGATACSAPKCVASRAVRALTAQPVLVHSESPWHSWRRAPPVKGLLDDGLRAQYVWQRA